MKPKKKKPVKKSGGKAASIAGRWLSREVGPKKRVILSAALRYTDEKWCARAIMQLIDDIDTLAASVLSQKEGK